MTWFQISFARLTPYDDGCMEVGEGGGLFGLIILPGPDVLTYNTFMFYIRKPES